MKMLFHPTQLLVVVLSLLMLSTTSFAETVPPVDRQFDLYWAKQRQVKNIHKRLFLKEGRHEFSLLAGVIPNDDFFTYYPVGFRYNYFFTEDLGLELSSSYMPNAQTDLKNFLEAEVVPTNKDGIEVFLPQFLEWQAGLGVLWTPLHGKLAMFSSKLGHFDFGIAMGVMALGTQAKRGDKDDDAPYQRRMDVGGNVGVTGKLYFNDFIALRVDYRHYFYVARDADDDSSRLSYPAEISLGVAFFTSAPN